MFIEPDQAIIPGEGIGIRIDSLPLEERNHLSISMFVRHRLDSLELSTPGASRLLHFQCDTR